MEFVDDTLLFCVAEEDQVKNVIAIFRCYEAILGLKVSLFKSALVRNSADAYLIACLADFMGCKVGSLPTSYLAPPLSIANVSKTLWNPINCGEN